MSITLRGKKIKFENYSYEHGRALVRKLSDGLNLDGKVSGFVFCVCVTSAEPKPTEWRKIINVAFICGFQWLILSSISNNTRVC
jgi:hypothetical protein